MKKAAVLLGLLMLIIGTYSGIGFAYNLSQLKNIQHKVLNNEHTDEMLDTQYRLLGDKLDHALIHTLKYSYEFLKNNGVLFRSVKEQFGLISNGLIHRSSDDSIFVGDQDLNIIKRIDKDDFAVISDGENTLAIMQPVGLYQLITLRLNMKDGDEKQLLVNINGTIPPQCHATIYVTDLCSKDGHAIGTYSCNDILNQSDCKSVASSLAGWISKKVIEYQKADENQ